ncbi:MAG: tRNA (N6-isopentenyl adenosine(37)-C2)-methylthiotransferase MiaB [Clostridiales bacterium]|nr:tRNA (N6-isopentenyl adenosine(37)-C2)-methylthiotransferase MiaB [Clostridiales bacterium]
MDSNKGFNKNAFSDWNLSEEALKVPFEEPARQYFFIAKCREIVKERSMESGRELLANVTTFGCQMNAKDSEKLRGILLEIGFTMTESEDADLVLYNTCTVRENANLKVYGHLGYLSNLKKKNPRMIIALCGCMMQEPDVVAKLQKSYRFVNLIFGTHNIFKFAELLYEVLEGQRKEEQMLLPEPSGAGGETLHLQKKAAPRMDTAVETPLPHQRHTAVKNPSPMIVDIWKDTDQVVEDLPADRTYSFKSGVNIMYGCNNFCTYCIVPYVRGRERSRRPEDIIHEIEQLSRDGVIEVMLLGQNVNSYGKTLDTPVSFACLLQMVEQVPGIQRIRFMTSHPKDLSDELIDVMKHSRKVCRHLHLPLQSGSSRILKKMNRRYTKEQYLELAAKLRREIPDISLTTDIIVGFPGETEEDFQETLDVVRQVRYDSAFTFIYSKRTGTPAAAMEDQVPDDVVKDRFQRLLTLVQDISQEMSKRVEGQTQPVLVESLNDHDPALVTGRLSNNLLVHFPGTKDLIGQIVNVRLSECKGFYYLGEQV